MKKLRYLTGTTTGTSHLGNYVGAIRPAIEAAKNPAIESFYFRAHYHALIKCHDPSGHARYWPALQSSFRRVALVYSESGLMQQGLCWLSVDWRESK
jgi:tryptophanyl-tRNA synthetase